ncbi:hypothetical protein [Kocuria tytonis]|uniref:hypothetical protein n=1 Tax=Kocuria tytonis TaxID=2054280 RepID=UPI0011C46E72|nr:hypothetical protein [Kocuria tytonis]
MPQETPAAGAQKIGWILWLLATLLWAAGLVIERLVYSGPLSCELGQGSSIYGEPGWSWVPLGHTCTWENVGGVTVVDEPSMMTLVPALVLFLWGISLMMARASRPQPRQNPE